MTTPSQCQFWNCDQTIHKDHFLCGEHYRQFTDGSINKCPSCGIYKAIRFDVCYNCYRQPTAAQASARPDAARRGDQELPADQKANEFFVYILNLDGGEYYVGHTRELHERLLEHRNNMSASTKGRNPKLVWFTTAPTRDEAASLEQYLQQLNSGPTGRREINRWVVQFKQLVDELDFSPSQPAAEPPAEQAPRPSGGIRRLFSRNK